MSEITDYSARRDWSPTAQPPGPDGVVAHTPNPSAYHHTGTSVTIPRAADDFGASQGFSTQPGVINIDPTDPAKGTGGQVIDLRKLSVEKSAEIAQAGSDALSRFAAVTQVMAMPQPIPTPVPPPTAVPLAEPVQPPVAAPQPAAPAAVSLDEQRSLLTLLQQMVNAPVQQPAPIIAPAPAPPAPLSPDYGGELGMPFLGREPQLPRVEVAFHFPQGIMRSAYHHVSVADRCLSLVFDARLTNYPQFVPQSPEQNGEMLPIRLDVPSLNFSEKVFIPDFHNVIGCLDIMNLVVEPSEPESPTTSLTGHQDLTGGY
jgi:hypothetical protein